MQQIVSVVAGVILGILSNYIYDYLRQIGWLPGKPTVRFLSVLTAVVCALIFLVAWPDLNTSNGVADRPPATPSPSVTPLQPMATQPPVPPSATRTPEPTLTSEPTPEPTVTSEPPTVTPRPTATSTPEPTAIPVSVYTFENGIDRDWQVVETFGFTNGALEGPGFMLYNKHTNNYQVKMTVRGVDFGIYANAESRKRGYFFFYRSDTKKCGWWKTRTDFFSGLSKPGFSTEEVSALSDQCTTIFSDNEFHEVIVRVQDDNFFASIDGQEIGGFAGRDYTDGRIGISGGASTIRTVEITPLP